ncbi:FMN reductase (NADPH) [Pigmentiphaga humi]|uniref:FMN reductase (NADPH) n=1 Tax=Pigmentiphaga humi TaxID=2478468 RepID=A0A3P4AXI9_9BURK|nr:nitroreductase family protein [Pigmentiphaga humi]VCU68251.1 FMN reductase (NADPH) [Pigmentiphaga humi]
MTSPDSQRIAELWAGRYGSAAAVPQAITPTLEGLLQHRSVRAYAPRALPADTAASMVAAAQSASSSSTLQAWSVVAVEDAGRKARLAELVGDQRHVRECPLFLVWLADLARLDEIGARRELARDSLDYLEMYTVGVIDAALAAQNAAVAAEAMGLGIVYIGGIRDQPEAVAAELGLPPRVFAAFGMCVGYPDPERPASVKPRLPQTAVLHRETYDAAAGEPAVQAYNATMSAFYGEQGMKTQGTWDTHSVHRVRGPAAMKGRDRLTEALHALGFPLK